MNHYFLENPDLETLERNLALEIFHTKFRFITHNGLFSCTEIDDASVTLIKSLPPLTGTLLDLGCGYGVLGIVLAKTYPIEVTMADINRTALTYAGKNAKLNQVHATTIHSDSFANISGTFDNIVLNPPIHAGKEVMYRMYEESAQHINPGGALYVVILKKHGAESTLKKLNALFSHVNILYKKKGCYVFQANKKAAH